MEFRGIIFDKDGTLFDYHTVWGPIIETYIDEILTSIDHWDEGQARKQFLRLVGIGDAQMHADGLLFATHKSIMFGRLFLFCRKYRLPFRVLVKHLKKAFEDAHTLMKGSLLTNQPADVEKLFETLKEFGYRVGVVTSDTERSTEVCLEHLNIAKYVDFISTYDDDLAGKPNPEALRFFCRKYSLKPEEVIVVGDSPIDLRFASKGKAGYSIAVLTGSNDRKRLKRLANCVYKDINELLTDMRIFPQAR